MSAVSDPKLARIADLAAELRVTERATAQARARFKQALRTAEAAGIRHGRIAEAAGVSRQRIQQLLAGRQANG